MRNIKSLFVFAFGLFFGLSAFAQNTDEQGRIIVNDEASFWAVQNNLGGSYIQTADITLTDAGSRTRQIGSTDQGAAFTGTYDGGGFTISVALSDGSNRNKGLFGENQGTITNLRLNGINVVADGGVSGNVQQVSVLCWKNVGTISNIYVTYCSVQNVTYFALTRCGGIISALNESNITNCHATNCTVDVYGNAGGLVGTMTGGNVSYCYFSGNVISEKEVAGSSTGNAGGIVGEISGGEIKGCFVEDGTTVTREGSANNLFFPRNAAGIASGNGVVSNCYTGATVSAGGGSYGDSYPISSGENLNSYTNNSGLSIEELVDALNAGLEPPAFEIGTDGQITYIDQTEFASELTTTRAGDFLSPATWGNKRFSNATATSVTIKHAVTLSDNVVIPDGITLNFDNGGSLTINEGGSFVTSNKEVKNLTINWPLIIPTTNGMRMISCTWMIILQEATAYLYGRIKHVRCLPFRLHIRTEI